MPKEAAILSTLNEAGHHPNLVKYHGWGRVYRVEMIAAGYEKMCCFTGGMNCNRLEEGRWEEILKLNYLFVYLLICICRCWSFYCDGMGGGRDSGAQDLTE